MGFYTGKSVIVTGAGSGIGRALALEMARRGARVFAADINGASAEETVRVAGPPAAAARLDVADAAAVEALVARVVAEHGQLDVMVNNAGVGVVGELQDVTVEDWSRIIDVNLKGVAYGTTAAYRQMVKQGGGTIANIASGYGLTYAPALTLYSTTKFGIVALTNMTALEGKAHGVRAVCICPGYLKTGIFETAVARGIKGRRLERAAPFKPRPVEQYVGEMLNGIEQGRRMVVLPRYVSVLWRLQRWAPWLMDVSYRRSLSRIRRGRDAPAGSSSRPNRS